MNTDPHPLSAPTNADPRPEIRTNRFSTAESLERAFLEDSQEFRLHDKRKIAYLI